MKLELKEPMVVKEARESQKGQHWVVEILLFVAVFALGTLAQMVILIPGELVMLFGSSTYQAAVQAGDMEGIVEASQQIASSDAYMVLSLFSDVLLMAVVFLFVRFLQKRRLATLGFVRTGVGREYLMGAICGFLLFSVAVLVSFLTGALQFDGIADNLSVGILILYLLGYMVQGMAEEVLCRGYLMVSVGRRYSMVAAVLFNAVFFAALHLLNEGISLLAFVNLTLFGIFASLYFIDRGSIWGIAAFHTVWNFVQGNFYGIRVSGMQVSSSILRMDSLEGKDVLNGGAFGLEGSIGVTIVLAVAIGYLYWKGKKNDNGNYE